MAQEQEKTQAQQTEAVAIEPGEFEALLKKEFKPKSDRQKEAITSAVKTLAEQALAGTVVISDDAVKSIEAIIAELDKRLSEQINLIMHHEDFQALEGGVEGPGFPILEYAAGLVNLPGPVQAHEDAQFLAGTEPGDLLGPR